MAYANPVPAFVSAPVRPLERRRGLRCRQSWHVRLLAGDEPGGIPAEVVDVSDAGCFLVTSVEPPVEAGERCAFGLPLPDGRCALAKGRVLRVAGCGLALKLEEVNAPFADLLRATRRDGSAGRDLLGVGL